MQDFQGRTPVRTNLNLEDSVRIINPAPGFSDLLKVDQSFKRPSYYGGEDNIYEVRKVLDHWNLDWKLTHAVKYVARAGKKSVETEIEDLEKSIQWIQFRVDQLKGKV